ncbi:nucleotidyltransferase domain-containing protein [Sphingomonas psychrotolerans]|uniref:Nucleotidyltransferase domain-containing protein n=1 Tax=Sphingomonas psychrotolerans TaxID=1327635 RepID=A0ABU3N474_9SPHN|nr:nucleotidyltransferase domain-containing protein [Sphingomonas psychrotolerans]MDT8759188.1 nucleotidyltransferase domain-containing protein [Sphingomonas psychrotolerans]
MSDKTILPAVRQEIESRLDRIEADNCVRLLLAVESGSRAWGFPSPDSDYDVRFLYVRSRDWYLSLVHDRDVIESPIENEVDLNGWDVRKALILLLKSNVVVSEWIESPIRYRPDDPFVQELSSLADDLLNPRAIAYHYSRSGKLAADRWLDGGDAVPVKKYFYALRPALAIRAIRLNPALRPPMNLQALVAVSELPAELVEQIDALVEAKARTNESANGIRLPEIDALIRGELGRAGELPARKLRDRFVDRANQLFLELVNA